MQVTQPFNVLRLISPDDTADLPMFAASGRLTDAVYVGVAGDVVVVMADNSTQVFTVPTGGTYHPWAVRRINAVNTTAQQLIACYAV